MILSYVHILYTSVSYVKFFSCYNVSMMLFTQVHKTSMEVAKGSVVLVHGSWGSSSMWMGYAQFLSQNGWDAYALDLRGHGRSEGNIAGATMEDYACDVKQVVAEYDIDNPAVIGHSMGGLVALMYSAEHDARAVVAIDPSPTKEVQGEGERKEYPAEYSPKDAGMPANPLHAMKAFPDVGILSMMRMKMMLGVESGVARSERKIGISVPKEKLSMPVLFVGGELGESVPFGIGIKTAKKMADYYVREVVEIKGATHPGILIGEHAMEAVQKIENWMSNH